MSTKTNAVIGVVALAALVAAFLQWNRAFRAESELAALTVDRDGLRSQLRTEKQRADLDVAALKDEINVLKAKQPVVVAPPPRLAPPPAAPAAEITDEQLHRASQAKAITNNLRQISATRDAFQRKFGRAPASLDEVVGEGKFIRALVPVDGEDYSTLSLVPGAPMALTTASGLTVNYDPSAPVAPLSPEEARLVELRKQIGPSAKRAADAYSAANNGAKPTNTDALLPYFATPQEGADFVEFIEAQKAVARKQLGK